MNYEKGFDRIGRVLANTVGILLLAGFMYLIRDITIFENIQTFAKIFLLGITVYFLGFTSVYLPFMAIYACVKWIYDGFQSKA